MRHLLLLSLILLLAAGLRFYRIDGAGFWADEFATLESSSGWGLSHKTLPTGVLESPPDLTTLQGARPLKFVWSGIAADENHPPLYFLLIRVWREILGDGEWAVRSFSAIASLASIILLFIAARLLHGPAPALWACLIMALAAPQIQFARETRSYSLLAALGLGAAVALILIEKRHFSIARATALGGCILGMLLTHYFAIAIITALGTYCLMRLRGRTRNGTILVFIAAGIFFLAIWGPSMLHQINNVGANNQWILEQREGHLKRTFLRLAVLPVRSLANIKENFYPIASVGIIFYALPLLAWRRRPELLLWSLWIVCGVGMIFILDLAQSTRQLGMVRYTLAAMPAMYMLLAAAISTFRPRLRHAIPAAAAIFCAIMLPRAYAIQEKQAQWRELAGYIEQHGRPDDAIIFAGPDHDIGYRGMLYMGVSHYMRDLPRPVATLNSPADASMLDRLPKGSRIWLISGWPDKKAQELLPGCTIEQPPILFQKTAVLWYVRL